MIRLFPHASYNFPHYKLYQDFIIVKALHPNFMSRFILSMSILYSTVARMKYGNKCFELFTLNEVYSCLWHYNNDKNFETLMSRFLE